MTPEEFNEMLAEALSQNLQITTTTHGYHEKYVEITIKYGEHLICWETIYL